MEIESHEFDPRPFNSELCNECDFRKNHPVHAIQGMLGLDGPIWVDVGPQKKFCLHNSWECSGRGQLVCHSCINCDWNWTSFDKDNFVYCSQCDPAIAATGNFITKDSGKREEYDSGMQRDVQDGKPRFDLLYPVGIPYSDQFLTRVAELLARGAKKYSERNWEKAEGKAELARFQGSALRHLTQWLCGETDEDHASAVVFNLMGAHLVEWKMSHDGE